MSDNMEQTDASQDSTQNEAQDDEIENQSSEQHDDQEDSESDDGQGQDDQTEEEDEIDIDGEKFKVPKSKAEKLKAGFLRQDDYTKKTQEVAEQKRAVEAERAVAYREAEEYITEVSQVVAIGQQIQQLEEYSRELNDPMEVLKIERAIRDLRNKADGLAKQVHQKREKKTLESQAASAKACQEGLAVLKREIPNWSNEVATSVGTYMISKGMGREVIAALDSHQIPGSAAIIKAFRDAQLYNQIRSKNIAKPSPKVQDKPVTRLTSAKSGAVKNPDKMSMDEWVRWRNNERNKKR